MFPVFILLWNCFNFLNNDIVMFCCFLPSARENWLCCVFGKKWTLGNLITPTLQLRTNSHEVLTLKSPYLRNIIEANSIGHFHKKYFLNFWNVFSRSTETSDPSITPHSSLLTIYRLSELFQCDPLVCFDVLWVEMYGMSVNLDVAIYLLRGFLLPKIEDFCLITTT